MNSFRKLTLALAALFILSSWNFMSEDDCLVLLPKISGKYEGECKKGKAHGIGKSVGTDTYEGEFKKGLPDGKGKYTWENGNFFEGTWKEGLKDGEGKLIALRPNLTDSIVTGFWKNDTYIGKYESPYYIDSKSSNINKILVTKQGISPSQIEISVMRKNQAIQYTNMRITSNTGNYYSGKFSVNHFPLELDIEFDSPSATGFGASKEKFNCKVKINEQGNWQITIDLSNV